MDGKQMGNLNELNEILFNQLGELNGTYKSEEELKVCIAKNKAVVDTAECILQNAKLQLDAMKFACDFTDIGDKNQGLIPKSSIPEVFGIQQKPLEN